MTLHDKEALTTASDRKKTYNFRRNMQPLTTTKYGETMRDDNIITTIVWHWYTIERQIDILYRLCACRAL